MYLDEKTLSALDVEMSVGALQDLHSHRNDVRKKLDMPGLHVRVCISPEELALHVSNQAYWAVMNFWYAIANIVASASVFTEENIVKPVQSGVSYAKELPSRAYESVTGWVKNTLSQLWYFIKLGVWVVSVKAWRSFHAFREQYVFDPLGVLFWKGYAMFKPAYNFVFVLDSED